MIGGVGMPLYTADAIQIINPGETVIFPTTVIPCNRGLVRHSDGTGDFLLSGWTPRRGCSCCCNNDPAAEYLVTFGANIAIAEGGTVGEISVAISKNGSTVPASIMSVTPAAVEEFFNVSRVLPVQVWSNCCETITIRNISDQPIEMINASLSLTRPDLLVSR